MDLSRVFYSIVHYMEEKFNISRANNFLLLCKSVLVEHIPIGYSSHPWRGGRAVECDGLENR